MEMIPRRFIQTWKVKAPLPSNFGYWSTTFKAHNHDFEHVILDDQDNRNFVAKHCPAFLLIYDIFDSEIFRADAVRPFYLFFLGGFYADMDFECLGSFEKYRSLDGPVLGSMGTDPTFEHSVPNALMGSPPGEVFWLLYAARIARYSAARRGQRPEYMTGPVVLKECVVYYQSDKDSAVAEALQFANEYLPPESLKGLRTSEISVLPGVEWYPLDWNDGIHQRFREDLIRREHMLNREEVDSLFSRSTAVTYWSHSWERTPTKLGGLLRNSGLLSRFGAVVRLLRRSRGAGVSR